MAQGWYVYQKGSACYKRCFAGDKIRLEGSLYWYLALQHTALRHNEVTQGWPFLSLALTFLRRLNSVRCLLLLVSHTVSVRGLEVRDICRIPSLKWEGSNSWRCHGRGVWSLYLLNRVTWGIAGFLTWHPRLLRWVSPEREQSRRHITLKI